MTDRIDPALKAAIRACRNAERASKGACFSGEHTAAEADARCDGAEGGCCYGLAPSSVEAAIAAYLAALPRREPSDAEVERAAEAVERLTGYDAVHCTEIARAALATLPELPTPDAAALRLPDINASGIIDEVCGEWAIKTPQGFATALWDRLATALVTPSAQAEIDARRNEDAAALRAEGFAEARDAAWALADRMWPEAHDLLDAIAALKMGDAAPPLPTNESYFDLVNTPVKPGDGR